MATKKKMLQAAAGSAGGASLDITDVFSTFLYDGQQTTLVVNNGIDLATEDGITWIKCRNASEDHFLFSSLQNSDGQTLFLKPNETNAANGTNGVSQTSTGFSLAGGDGLTNQINKQYASWTFRKAPKFFDIVGPFTGDGVNGRVLSHNLGSTPGLVIIKRTSTGTAAQGSWFTYHRSAGFSGGLILNESEPAGYAFASPITAASDTTITINNPANNGNINALGESYIAYLFAHNEGDGTFGPDSDQDVVKCGSYTAVSAGTEIDIGFEPQWIMIKKSSGPESWYMYDAMRGVKNGGGNSQDKKIRANYNSAEAAVTAPIIAFSARGFILESTDNEINGSGGTYTFMAIRRGPLAVATDPTKVFSMDTWGSGPPAFTSGFPVDLAWTKDINSGGGQWYWLDRLRGEPTLQSTGELPEDPAPNAIVDAGDNPFDFQDGWYDKTGTATDYQSWMWKREPGYFDCLAYTGDGTSGRILSHNLSASPELILLKRRDGTLDWGVYSKDIPSGHVLFLNQDYQSISQDWFGSTFNKTSFQLGSEYTNGSNVDYIAYLFASAPGVSKVGSYSGNNTYQTISCDFTSGARFILIKKTNGSGGDWYVWDSARGIVSANSPHLSLNTAGANVTTDDSIDPDSSGFIVNQVSATNINVTGGEYIFYAIA